MSCCIIQRYDNRNENTITKKRYTIKTTTMKAEVDVKELINQIVDLKIKLKETEKALIESQERTLYWLKRSDDDLDKVFAFRKENEALKARIAELKNQPTQN